MRFAAIPLLLAAASFANADTVQGDLGAKLDTYLTRLEANGFSGAVLIAKDGDIALEKAYGQADRESERPVTTDTVFDIGSITKQFTAAAIMKLWDEGKLHPADTIDKYFDNVPDDKRIMSIHHLLTHTAGLRDGFGRDYEVMERDALMQEILETRLRRPVGERYMYSNAGYSMLGAIIEKVSGMGYEEYLRKSFFDPLGMTQTGYVLPEWNKEKLAVGYVNADRWGTPLDHLWAEDGPYWNLRCNGGILSTVGDMYTWHNALLTDTVLSGQARDRMFTPLAKEGPGDSSHYGYGWTVHDSAYGGKLIAHNGGNGVFFADCYRYLDNDVFIVLMTNAAEEFDATAPIIALCYDREVELPELDPPAWKNTDQESTPEN